MSLTIDDIPSVSVPSPIKKDDILYAANLAEGNPVDNYTNAIQEVSMTGDSTLVNNEKAKWLQEQVDSNKKTVEELISDNTLPVETRRKVMEAYVQNAIPLQDLRDKFLIQSAIQDVSTSVEDKEAADLYSEEVTLRDEEKANNLATVSISSGTENIGSIIQDATIAAGKTAASVGSSLALMIPAGLVGAFALITEQNPEKAAEITKIIQEYAYSPKGSSSSDEASRVISEKIADAAQTIDIPFKWLSDKAYTNAININKEYKRIGVSARENPALAGTVSRVYQTAASMMIGVTKPKVKPRSPIDTIETASKEQAGNLTAKALADNTGRTAEAFGVTKEELLNTYILPKLNDEFGPITTDARVALDKLDKALLDVAKETEISPHVYPVSKILKEREDYVKILTEVERPHLLLSSSVLDIPATEKLFGRSKKGYEALIESTATKLEGTAVFGRNANYGYKTEAWANRYKKQLEENTKHLPDPGKFEVLERDGQFYISWKFSRQYTPHESLAFGEDTLSSHIFSRKLDITEFANGIGRHVIPNYMRMKGDIPAQGAAAAREEARIESIFLREARDTFIQTKTPKELAASLLKGEEEGIVWTAEDIRIQHPHLTRAQQDQLHLEYAAYRRIVDHMYALSDRQFRKNLVDKEMKSLYNNNGEFVTHVTEPIKEIPAGVTRVLDLVNNTTIKIDKELPIVKLNSPVRVGDHIHTYAQLPLNYQLGPIRAGALTNVPGYIPRYYKEWFVVDKVPKALWVDGAKVGKEELRNYKEAVAMAGTRKELDSLMEKFAKEDPDNVYVSRKEEKDINDKIIHDSQVYDTYLKQIHRRGERLPSLDRKAETEDVLVALTKAIRSTSKVVAWDDITKVRRDNFIKAYGKFTQGRFPNQITDIVPLSKMSPKEERQFLAAQSVYSQFELEQVASTQSDIVWRNGLNNVADVFEKLPVDASILREWGEKGFIPARTIKSFGSNLFLYWRVPRMWVVQPQQWKELIAISPSYAKHLAEIEPIFLGLISRTHTLKGLRSYTDALGRKTVKDYDAIMNALDESGIIQSVDMNQMVHGIWKDATKELNPKPVKGVLGVTEKALEAVTATAAFPGKVGRSLGYNPSELTNQVSLWLFARHRWMEKNPGKDWNIPEHRAQIARDQSLYSHMSSTRAGMFGWQEGMISTFTQFVAIPWKSTMQMFSAPQLTGAEKARLAGARLFWYGKYGIPLGAVIYKTIDKNLEEKQDRETLAAWTESATDRIWNATLHAMFDAPNQQTRVDTKNLSTSIEGDYVWDVIHTLVEMSKGNTVETPKINFPYEQASGSIMEAVRTVYDIFKINDKGPLDLETWKVASWKAVSFAGTFSDFNKAMLAEGMSKAGNAIGYKQTRGEAVARLFGVPPMEESLIHMTNRSQMERRKEVTNTAKQIHQRLISVMQAKGIDEVEKQKEYLEGLSAFLNIVPAYYKTELTEEIFKLDRRSWKEKKTSLLLNLYQNGLDARDSKYIEMRNTLEKSNDPEIKSMLNDLEAIKQRSLK